MGIKERREREKSERRDLILRAAISVYMGEGYHGTTMDKIAEKAELSRATLYLYFKTKDEIFVNAIVNQSDYFTKLLDGIYDRKKELGRELPRELWYSFKKFYDSDPATLDATLYFHQGQMLKSLPEHLRLELDRSGSKNFNRLSGIMEYGINEGFFKRCNPKTLAEFVWTAFLGIIHLENSKAAMSRKTHINETWTLGLEILERGLANDHVN
ncbi:TetR/AcrR family transcriptional regulator [Thermodesulfobacteriota bacterium]